MPMRWAVFSFQGISLSASFASALDAAREALVVVEDEALLEEVAGLVEWPVVLTGLAVLTGVVGRLHVELASCGG